MRKQESDERSTVQARPDEKRARSGKWKRRILFAVLFLFVAAGLSGAAYLMGVVLPRHNKQAANDTFIPALRAAQVGDYVTLGSYEQDNDLSDGAEPIEWLVLAREDEKLLLLSRYALDCMPFNGSDGLTAWDYSSILPWLNDTFYTSAFSAPEKTAVLVSRVEADRNTLFDTYPGKATDSRVFLLSIADVDTYFRNEEARCCFPTAYAVAQGTKTAESGTCMWWLRTPGYDGSAAARVLADGTVSFIGQPAQRTLGVRPAIWVSCGENIAD